MASHWQNYVSALNKYHEPTVCKELGQRLLPKMPLSFYPLFLSCDGMGCQCSRIKMQSALIGHEGVKRHTDVLGIPEAISLL